jgi:hypothetical protein
MKLGKVLVSSHCIGEKTLTTIELQHPVLSTAVKSALASRKAFSKVDL